MSSSRRLRRPLNWPAHNTLPNALNDVLPALTAAIVVNEFLVVAVLCNNTLDTELSEIAYSLSAFLSSNVTDSELQASVFHTLDVGTGGWVTVVAVSNVMR